MSAIQFISVGVKGRCLGIVVGVSFVTISALNLLQNIGFNDNLHQANGPFFNPLSGSMVAASQHSVFSISHEGKRWYDASLAREQLQTEPRWSGLLQCGGNHHHIAQTARHAVPN